MNLKWNVAVENDPANGNVGVSIIAAADSIVLKDLLPPNIARQLAAALLQGAETVSPTPPPTPKPTDDVAASPAPSPSPQVAPQAAP